MLRLSPCFSVVFGLVACLSGASTAQASAAKVHAIDAAAVSAAQHELDVRSVQLLPAFLAEGSAEADEAPDSLGVAVLPLVHAATAEAFGRQARPTTCVEQARVRTQRARGPPARDLR